MSINEIVGSNIRKIRKERGLLIKELAKKAYMDKSSISNFENGRSSVSIIGLTRLSAALQCKTIDLLQGVEG